MDKLMLELKKKRSLKGLRTAVSEVLKADPGDMKDFNYNVGPHKWRGTIYQKRNSLMGTVVSFFDTKLYVIRGYPKIKYSDDSRVYLKACVAQEKIDGSNFGIFLLPDGTMMSKTRMAVNWNSPAFKRKEKTWHQLFEMIDNGNLLKRINEMLVNHDYIVYGELYGKLNPGDFVKYTVDIAFKVFDIIDRKTNRFLPASEVYRLCEFYGIPFVNETWSGILTDKEIQRIEFELQDQLKDDGMEGWVAKTFLTDEKDTYMCKLKCEKVKEECWRKDRKPMIPTLIVRKAVRKTLENFPEAKTIEDMEPHVLSELREEVEEVLIQESIDKIRASIRFAITPSNEELLKLVIQKLTEMQLKGIDIRNKGHALSNLASLLGTISGGTLYRLYQAALREMKA